MDPSATQAKIPPRLITTNNRPDIHESSCATANVIAKLYRFCANAQICDGRVLRCGWYSHLEQHGVQNYLERRNCGLTGSLCSLISGGRPGILSMASTSKRVGQSCRCRSARKRCAVRTSMLCLA